MDGMEAPKDGNAFAAAPPPVDGLGNYKGVMLCNRPVEDSHPARMRNSSDHPPPFKNCVPQGVREQLGLQPCKKLEPRSMVKTRGSSAALRRHLQWIKELQVQVAEEHQKVADDQQLQEQRQQRMQELFKQQRDNIKELKSNGLNTLSDVQKLESHLQLKAKPGKSRASGKKPLWAMTEEEKEGMEDDEAAALIDFAENLDFEKYLSDTEFRQCFQVMQDRAKKLQREQDRFKDDLIADFNALAGDDDEYGSAYTGTPRGSQVEGGSQLGDMPGRTGVARGRAGKNGRPDWDSSTAMGDDAPTVDREVRSDAGRILDAMPQLKGIHSKESVQRIIEKTREDTPVGRG